jgi:predicted alpha-1,6-mannanase (GH76 family)
VQRIRSSIVVAAGFALIAGVLAPSAAQAAAPAGSPPTAAAGSGASPASRPAQPTTASREAQAQAGHGLNDAAPTTAGRQAQGSKQALPSWKAVSPDASTVPLTAATVVCTLVCDGQAAAGLAADTTPVPAVTVGGRTVQLHTSLPDGLGWAVSPNAKKGDQLWVERTFDGGTTREQPLAPISVTAAGKNLTAAANIADPSNHRRGELRACLSTPNGKSACTSWSYTTSCDTICDGAAHGAAVTHPVADAVSSGASVRLSFNAHSGGFATITGGTAGDRASVQRSWNEGTSTAGGGSLGAVTLRSGATASTAAFVAAEPRLKLAGGSLRACEYIASTQQTACTAWARPNVDHVAAAADALAYSYDPYTAWWPSSWWNSAVAIDTVAQYQQTTGDTEYAWMIDRMFEVNKASFPADVKSTDPLPGNFVSRAIDDGGWWAMAWIRAYDLTGSAKYLDMAEYIGNYTYSYWDTSTCGGGVWWNAEKTYKNAVVNGQFIEIAAELHNRISGDSTWLDRATTAWNWYQSVGLAGANGLVNDGLSDDCTNNGQTVWTYNQGLAIGNGVELYKATGNTAYLTSAEHLADAAMSSSLVQDGILTESCDPLTAAAACDDNQKQFKGVFERYMTDLAGVAGGSYATFDATQAASVWNTDRDSLNQLGERWNGATSDASPNVRDWRTQASALTALLSVS